MKKVALLADGWRRLVTYSWVDGIMKGAREAGEEICLDYLMDVQNLQVLI